MHSVLWKALVRIQQDFWGKSEWKSKKETVKELDPDELTQQQTDGS